MEKTLVEIEEAQFEQDVKNLSWKDLSTKYDLSVGQLKIAMQQLGLRKERATTAKFIIKRKEPVITADIAAEVQSSGLLHIEEVPAEQLEPVLEAPVRDIPF